MSALVLALLIAAPLVENPSQVTGFEAYEIATNLAEGHGYSFRGNQSWLFDDRPGDIGYFPTAWVDPVYTILLAALIRAAGDWHLIAGALLNVVLFVAAVMLTFRLAASYAGVAAGAFAAILLAASAYFQANEWFSCLNNTVLATVAVLLFASALRGAVTTPTRRNAVILGLATGFAVLACPPAIGFLPIAIILVALASQQCWSTAVSNFALALFVSILVLVPWATRNYLVFDEFVPVRTGSGQIAFVGTVEAGIMVQPETSKSSLDPPGRASNARQAIAPAFEERFRQTLESFQRRYGRVVAGDPWNGMNEAQRDKWFQRETWAYLREHPLLSMKLAFWKLAAFAQRTGQLGTLLLALALVGGVLAITAWRLELFALSLLIAAYAAPFALVIPYFVRYRLPIEPIIVVAATLTLWQIARFGRDQRLTSLNQTLT
jgi:hypothetical protein